MNTSKQPKVKDKANSRTLKVDAWTLQFVNHLELHLAAVHHSANGMNLEELQRTTADAVIDTFIESGMTHHDVATLLGHALFERQSPQPLAGWTESLNQRRVELIDKKIQGALTPTEHLELEGLTQIMRDNLDTEETLPMEGAKALHLKLLQLQSLSKST